ncbi:translocase of the outer mitochondrial membrane [Ophidiomyces ophidiicola]|nr:translocase of the outer mitochondrial membrane [Ophidiomyces ophidiicola]KAI1989734.1 translocase of the outer mitochondrial membrane [Ophidiomyces ophidiicola]
MVQFSEETKERITKVIDVSRVAIHYGYLPLIIYLANRDRRFSSSSRLSHRLETQRPCKRPRSVFPASIEYTMGKFGPI